MMDRLKIAVGVLLGVPPGKSTFREERPDEMAVSGRELTRARGCSNTQASGHANPAAIFNRSSDVRAALIRDLTFVRKHVREYGVAELTADDVETLTTRCINELLVVADE